MSPLRIISLCMVCVIVIGCSSYPQSNHSQEANSDRTIHLNSAAEDTAVTQSGINTDDTLVLGYLRTRKLLVRLETGGKFSFFELSGYPIVLSLNKIEFREKFPRLYDTFVKGIADGELGNIVIYAGL